MPMHKGEWHRTNGKLRRIRKSHLKTRKIVHNAEVVESTPRDEVDEIIPIRLEAILNGLWSSMSLGEKTMAISTRYFDPSNPAND